MARQWGDREALNFSLSLPSYTRFVFIFYIFFEQIIRIALTPPSIPIFIPRAPIRAPKAQQLTQDERRDC
jgi:hypothetical protein